MADETKRIALEKGGFAGDNSFQIAESYRAIRTNLLFSLANTDNHVVLVSSAEPGAGKSTFVANLAIVMAQMGAKVLLIDADMRKPQQHRHFRVQRTQGLSKILAGIGTLEENLFKEVVPGLDLLACGPIPPNPSELLGSQRMEGLLRELRNSYDYIFVDTPPVQVVTDAVVLAPQAAGVVLVVRQNQTLLSELQDTVETLDHSGTKLLGTVLTDVERGRGVYYRKTYRSYTKYNYVYAATDNDQD